MRRELVRYTCDVCDRMIEVVRPSEPKDVAEGWRWIYLSRDLEASPQSGKTLCFDCASKVERFLGGDQWSLYYPPEEETDTSPPVTRSVRGI